MFGWEFPPHNSGGLGTACQGLTKGLTNKGVKVNLVLPREEGIKVDEINLIFVDQSSQEVYIISNSKGLSPLVKKFPVLSLKIVPRNGLSSLLSRLKKEDIALIYDPESIIKE